MHYDIDNRELEGVDMVRFGSNRPNNQAFDLSSSMF